MSAAGRRVGAGPVAVLERLGRLLLGALVVVAPTFNPVVARSETGRLYLGQLVVLVVIAVGLLVWLLQGHVRHALVVGAVAAAFLVCQVVLTDPSTSVNRLIWAVRPLLPLMLALAVVALVRSTRLTTWVVLAVGGAALGLVLGVFGWLVPSLDVTEVTRPTLDLIVASGTIPRAVGGFVYPNNLGTFGAYVSVTGLWLVLSPFERRLRWLGAVAYLAGVAAFTASGNRAGALGWAVGALFLVLRWFRCHGATRERWRLALGAAAAAAAVVALTVALSPLARSHKVPRLEGRPTTGFAEDRLTTAFSSSFSVRWHDWTRHLRLWTHDPVVGIGAVGQRTDNTFVMWLSAAGVLGVVLLAVLVHQCWFAVPRTGTPLRAWGSTTTLRTAMLLVIGVSGLLQDSLGQPLASWFPGIVIGLALVHGTAPEPLTDEPPAAAAPPRRSHGGTPPG